MLLPIPMHKTVGSLLLSHTQSHRLFFNLSSKSRSKNSKDKVAVEAEAQSTVRKDRDHRASLFTQMSHFPILRGHPSL